MATFTAPPEPGGMIKRVKVCIGDEWTEMNFGRPIPRDEAMQRARQALEALA